MSKEECKHEWQPNGNNLYWCRKCGLIRSSVEIEKDKQIEQLKAENERLQGENVLARETKINTNKMDVLHLEIEVCELKQQLKEKDEEIERCRQGWKESQDRYNELYLKSLNNTKQVCEKIRRWDDSCHKPRISFNEYVEQLMKFLDQIERGEE